MSISALGRALEFIARISRLVAVLIGVLAAAVMVYFIVAFVAGYPVFPEIASKEMKKFLTLGTGFVAIDGPWYAYRTSRHRVSRRIVRLYLRSNGLLLALALFFALDALLNAERGSSPLWPVIYAISAVLIGLNTFFQLDGQCRKAITGDNEGN